MEVALLQGSSQGNEGTNVMVSFSVILILQTEICEARTASLPQLLSTRPRTEWCADMGIFLGGVV